MKNLKHILGTLFVSALVFTSCSTKEENDTEIIIPATAAEFRNIQDDALKGLTQTFQFDAADGSITLTSENGVDIRLNTANLTLNGNPITGTIDLEFVELFDRANMLVTNKPTMGLMADGNKALLISGGEFFINAAQNGADLQLNGTIQLGIPANLTGDIDPDMILWDGNIDDNGDLVWEEAQNENGDERGVFAEHTNYYAFIGDFGWTNVDRFYNDPREKTTILVAVPEGYDNTNSSVYLSYDGEPAALANLDTYDASTGLFSEHYGQIPVGLECHVIFVSEDASNWKYAVQAATIVENGIITITESETTTVTQAQLAAIINALP
ncbi:hypothetical protein SAMN04489722_103412 [Algibacter lectus]|uniref:hypothetical protein n=1 Tax=Algibacter lectus TaxID=221126 RepID=UPI0008ECB511|nr:hypothetical protein [Algibacter lectus]SFC77860.1 hypothetical protein SAMN04489722_103412 [Algibacter lectus]